MNAGRGTVHLVGAGPGDPDLITVRGLGLLRSADVVIYDRLVSRALLVQAKRGAELIDVGKAPGAHAGAQEGINALLVDRARRGLTVVRLKGGDPFVFGRGIEEVHACAAAGIDCQVVPGVSSAIAAPAAAGIPVTARGIGRSFVVVTARTRAGDSSPQIDYRAVASIDTIVILMGRGMLAETAGRLIEAGRSADEPAACIERATTSRQRIVRGTLGTIARAADSAGLAAPLVTVVGSTVSLAEAGVMVGRLSAHQVA